MYINTDYIYHIMTKIDYTGITTDQHAVINNIIDCFNFNKVYKHMEHVGWKWLSDEKDRYGNNIMALPDISELRQALRRLLVHAFQSVNKLKQEEPDYSGPCYSSCGGFTVYCWPNDMCQAFFSVTDWWIDPEDLNS